MDLSPLQLSLSSAQVQKKVSSLAPLLLAWYDQNKRELPWRQDNSAYRVWVSEIMLQQTRVAAVIPYFERFMQALPTVQALAQADETTLAKLWEGLGYYSRMRNLQRAAQKVVSDYNGVLPNDYEALLKLPGIGEYTAGAVASIAYGIAVAAVDGNVYRVLARLLSSPADIAQPKVKQAFKQVDELMLSPTRPGDFNQAMMELGATVCLPNTVPNCPVCPLSAHCLGLKNKTAAALPNKSPKKPRRIEQKTVVLFCKGGKVLLQKRPPKGLLAGLWEFMMFDDFLQPEELPAYLEQKGIKPLKISALGQAKHIFSHVEWHMTGYEVQVNDFPLRASMVWATPEEIDSTYAIASALNAYKQALLSSQLTLF